MKYFNFEPALLTKTETKWLLDKVDISKGYEYRIKSDIKKKLKVFTDLEIPLLIKKGIIANTDLSVFTQNLRTNPQNRVDKISQLTSINENRAQNMVGRKGLI
jgi:hypothetical protein